MLQLAASLILKLLRLQSPWTGLQMASLWRKFPNAELTIVPAERGKQVIEDIKD